MGAEERRQFDNAPTPRSHFGHDLVGPARDIAPHMGNVSELVQVHTGPVKVSRHRQELAAEGAPGEEGGTAFGQRRLDQEPLYRQALGRRPGHDPGLFLGRQAHTDHALAPTRPTP